MASIELIAKSNPRTNITLSINKQQTNRQRICDTEENQSIVFISIRNVLALIILVAPCRSSFSEVHGHIRGSVEETFAAVSSFINEHLDGTDEFIDQTEKADLRRQLVQYKRQRKPKAVQEPEISEQIADAVYKSKTFKPERRPKPKSSKRRPNQTCGKPPKTCEMDLCTSSKLACIGGSWYCLHTPKKCPAGETCDVKEKRLVDSNNAVIKQYSTYGMTDSFWCQLTDWATKALSTGSRVWLSLIKIQGAVRTTKKTGKNFRSNYPDLLIPSRSDPKTVLIPVDALKDKNFQVNTVNRTGDNDPYNTDDWFSLCGLDQYDQTDLKFIGLYIDGEPIGVPGNTNPNPGVQKEGVKRSYNKFVSHAAGVGIKICEE
ncbi:hypothetical protein ACHAXN_004636 [Cyclotella atomus]